jgi:hypothetical protein
MQSMIFEISIIIFRLEIENNFGFNCFVHFGQFGTNGVESMDEAELEGGGDNGGHQKNTGVFY